MEDAQLTDKPSLTLTREYAAPPERLWQAWTEAKALKQWWGPAPGEPVSVAELDVRVGGSLRIVMQGPDGNKYPMKGEFREVTPPERLVFTNIAIDQDGKHLLEGETTVILSESNGKTTLTLQTHAIGLVPLALQMLAGMEAGWNQSIDKLAELFLRSAAR